MRTEPNRPEAVMIVPRISLVMMMAGALAFGSGWLLTACEEGNSGDDEIVEDLNEAWEELQASEGKEDGATCSGVRPPDNNGFDKRIALTFDDGPDLTRTARVLEVLDAHGATATFFINGKNVTSEAKWDLLRQMAADGHILGNHSQNHENSRNVSLETWRRSVQQTHDILTEVLEPLHRVPTYFRFPFGSANCSTYGLVTSFGYHVTGWHIDSADWCFNSSSGGYGYCSPSTFRYVPDTYRGDYVRWILYQVGQTGGGIMLMHDIHRFTTENLDRVLTALEDAGYTFTTLDDVETFPLLNGVTPPRDPWIGDPCEDHSECDFTSGDVPGFCHTFLTSDTEELRGFCSLPCDGYCPDLDNTAPTFCVATGDPTVGRCVSKAWPINESCATIPGTAALEQDRFVYESGASSGTALVCVPR